MVAFGAYAGVAQAREAGPSNLTPAEAVALLEQDGITVNADTLNSLMLSGPAILESEQPETIGVGGGGNRGGGGSNDGW